MELKSAASKLFSPAGFFEKRSSDNQVGGETKRKKARTEAREGQRRSEKDASEPCARLKLDPVSGDTPWLASRSHSSKSFHWLGAPTCRLGTVGAHVTGYEVYKCIRASGELRMGRGDLKPSWKHSHLIAISNIAEYYKRSLSLRELQQTLTK